MFVADLNPKPDLNQGGNANPGPQDQRRHARAVDHHWAGAGVEMDKRLSGWADRSSKSRNNIRESMSRVETHLRGGHRCQAEPTCNGTGLAGTASHRSFGAGAPIPGGTGPSPGRHKGGTGCAGVDFYASPAATGASGADDLKPRNAGD